jgi:hypothetical protein
MPEPKQSKFLFWLKRIGLAGFMFFLIKGLIWLLLAYCIGKGIF